MVQAPTSVERDIVKAFVARVSDLAVWGSFPRLVFANVAPTFEGCDRVSNSMHKLTELCMISVFDSLWSVWCT